MALAGLPTSIASPHNPAYLARALAPLLETVCLQRVCGPSGRMSWGADRYWDQATQYFLYPPL
jgi:hypothetical protein